MAHGNAKYKDEEKVKELICERISTSNDSLRTICNAEGMPCVATVLKWLREDEKFVAQYARAKREQADLLVEQIIEIADTCREGTKTVEKATGVEITTGDMVERSRLMVDARKWAASKMNPKKYGEKLDVTSDGNPIQQTLNIAIDGKKIKLE
jgi:hypothetical protein